MDNLKNNDKMTFIGPAGTGKTILALAKAKKDYLSGKNVLILYHNNEIKNDVKKMVSLVRKKDLTNRLEVSTKYSFYFRYINQGEDYSYDEAEKSFLHAIISDEWDTIIIDEAQDFEEKVIDKIKNIKCKQLYIFYDQYQSLNRPANYNLNYLNMQSTFNLTKSLRSTDQIVSSSYSLIEVNDIESYQNNIKGKKPLLITLKEFDKVTENLECINNQLSPHIKDNILILTTSIIEKSRIIGLRCTIGTSLFCTQKMNQFADKAFRKSSLMRLMETFTSSNNNKDEVESIDEDCCEKCIKKHIFTVREAKGIEYKSVFIFDERNILLDISNGNNSSNRLLYTAMTRAQFQVVIFSCFRTGIDYKELSRRLSLDIQEFTTINEGINYINSTIH